MWLRSGLLRLWPRLALAAPISPLAQELPYAAVTIKRKEKKKKKKKKRHLDFGLLVLKMAKK